MLKKIISSSVLTVVLIVSLLAFPVLAEVTYSSDYDDNAVIKLMGETNVFDLKSKASLLMDADTGTIILESNSHERLPIASITKIMSMLLFMEAIDSGRMSYDDIVVTSPHAASMDGSVAYLEVGEKFTVRDGLKAIAVHSSNDVTVAMAEKVAGSEEAFVVMMNEKAQELGMMDTNFLDCTGLTNEGHYSTAYDVAIMSRELINKHPDILQFTSIWHDTFRDGKFSLDNTNKLVWYYKGTKGLKTGYTSKAGHCLSNYTERDNLRLISVILGGPDSNTRFAETRKLLDYGFANYELTQVSKAGDLVQQVEIKKGLETKVGAVYPEDVKLLLKKGEKSKLVIEPNIIPNLEAPIKKGEKLGEVIYKVGEREVGRTDIVAEEEVKKASFLKLLFRMIKSWFSFGKK